MVRTRNNQKQPKAIASTQMLFLQGILGGLAQNGI
jgi:hypothetical protein